MKTTPRNPSYEPSINRIARLLKVKQQHTETPPPSHYPPAPEETHAQRATRLLKAASADLQLISIRSRFGPNNRNANHC
ncbi:MAG: hypothetical protein E6R03_02050 [Hyphomicrobiaceae bacterium]|nr:MAG: hypothetical protein E6R03_02050 [Hyphomicrobiaceae bacterium]